MDRDDWIVIMIKVLVQIAYEANPVERTWRTVGWITYDACQQPFKRDRKCHIRFEVVQDVSIR